MVNSIHSERTEFYKEHLSKVHKMSNNIELAQDRIIETVGNICSKFGLNHFMAQLYVVLYMSIEPLSLDDLVQRLKVSKSNVSVTIRELERWGVVRKIWVKGSRKDFYEAKAEIKNIVLDRVRSSIRNKINEISIALDKFNEEISTEGTVTDVEEKALKDFYRERIKRVEEIKDLISNALIFSEKFL